jgi:hypothetical protein
MAAGEMAMGMRLSDWHRRKSYGRGQSPSSGETQRHQQGGRETRMIPALRSPLGQVYMKLTAAMAIARLLFCW